MDMHQYASLHPATAGRQDAPVARLLCTRFAEQVPRGAPLPRGAGPHRVASPARRRAGAHLPPPASIWWPHGADAGDGSLRGHPARRGSRHADRPDPAAPEFSRRQGGPHQPALCRKGTPSWQGSFGLQRFPTICPCWVGGEPSPCGPTCPRPAPVPRSWAGPSGPGQLHLHPRTKKRPSGLFF